MYCLYCLAFHFPAISIIILIGKKKSPILSANFAYKPTKKEGIKSW
jgi:hypothetical protein